MFAGGSISAATGRGCAGRGAVVSFCSASYHASVECNGQDQLAALIPPALTPQSVVNDEDGRPTYIAWLDVAPVRILGVSVAIFEGHAQTQYVLAGSNANPDVLMQMIGGVGGGAPERTLMFPPGYGFWMPGPGGDAKQAHLDLHVSCNSGRFQAWYTLYYVMAQ